MSVVVPVSGSHTQLMSGDNGFANVMATLREMDRVEHVFESLRSQINGMCIQYPQHTVVPQVLSMVETMVGPLEIEKEQKEFAESLKMTVETIMPWSKFLSYSSVMSQ